MLRVVKMVLIAWVAIFAFLSGIFDLVHWGNTVEAVGMVTSMNSWPGGATSWKAINSALLNGLGALWIIGGDLTAAVLCIAGVARLWRARYAHEGEFALAKRIALAGCGVLVIMLFGGFIVLAEAWFELWRSDALRGPVLDTAYRYLGSILLIALFVASKEPE
jgi:predicted small integral membrane protein